MLGGYSGGPRQDEGDGGKVQCHGREGGEKQLDSARVNKIRSVKYSLGLNVGVGERAESRLGEVSAADGHISAPPSVRPGEAGETAVSGEEEEFGPGRQFG